MGEFTYSAKLYVEATEAVDRWFWSQWNPRMKFDKFLTIPKHGLHICGSETILRQHFNTLHGYVPHVEGVGGLCSFKDDMYHLWIVSNHRVNQWTLGHEYSHMLNQYDLEIPNPDGATKKEYYR